MKICRDSIQLGACDTWTRSFWIAQADFNGDGQLDLLVAAQNFFSSTVLSLLLGRGDGTFESPIDIDPAKTPGTVLASKASPVVADFNGDQKLDVAVVVDFLVPASSPKVPPVLRVLLGNGDGTFQAPQDASLPFIPDSLSVGDFNRDKSPDVTIASDHGISVLLNTNLTPAEFTLAVTSGGSGTGIVTSSPAGIDCGGSSCTASFPTGTSIVLTAAPHPGSIFAGWSGACNGTDPNMCGVTLNTNQSVTAMFNLPADFALQPAATNLTLNRGAQVSDALALPIQGGFSGTIALTCAVSGPAPMPTCGVSPNSVTPGNSATLTVNAAGLSVAITPQSSRGLLVLYAAWLPFGLLGCVLAIDPDKKRGRKWGLGLLMAAAILPAACGGGSDSTRTHVSQTYMVSVTATSGGIQHSANITVTVP
jgi:hypothetical protein